MTRYVLGFMFDEKLENVLLIQKQRPAWQRGKWNGVGGHVELGEIEIDAIRREFEEETGIITKQSDWKICTTMMGEDWGCVVYTGIGPIHTAEQLTDENLNVVDVDSMVEICTIIDNLKYLVPIAKESVQGRLHSIPNFSYGGNSGE